MSTEPDRIRVWRCGPDYPWKYTASLEAWRDDPSDPYDVVDQWDGDSPGEALDALRSENPRASRVPAECVEYS